jgi:hypothetical protein
LYVNGVLHSTAAHPYAVDYDTRPMFFGTSGESWDGRLAGTLDEVSLYDRALSLQEVAALYASGSNGKCLVDVLGLDNAAPLDDISASQGGGSFFKVTVPPAMASLSVSTVGGTGDADLYRSHHWPRPAAVFPVAAALNGAFVLTTGRKGCGIMVGSRTDCEVKP